MTVKFEITHPNNVKQTHTEYNVQDQNKINALISLLQDLTGVKDIKASVE